MDTLKYILKKFNLSYNKKTRMPVYIQSTDRIGLADLFKELGFKVGVEIGVERGKYSEVLCKANPEAKLYGIDCWVAHEHSSYNNQVHLDQYRKEAIKRLAPYNCQIIDKYSLDAVKDFTDNSLDFVYIDGNHDFQNVVADIAGWSRKVRIGGIISGHDYQRPVGKVFFHVVEAVSGYTRAYNIRPWFLLGRRTRSFMWVRKEEHGYS